MTPESFPGEPHGIPPPEEEAGVAKALQRSLFVLLLLGAIAGGAVWWFAQSPAGSGAPSTGARTNSPASIPIVRFTDITTESGIHFRHVTGARGEKWLPETMGGGVACFDCDQDGDTDLLFINGTAWPGTKGTNPLPTTAALYRNDTIPGGPIRFTDITTGSGLDVPLYGMGVACGDFDGDGRVDVFVTAVGGNRLFRNLGGGRFLDVTSTAGVGGTGTEWSTAAAWIDVDNDGDLDLYVGNYVQWSPELDRQAATQLPGIGRAYGRPWNFAGTLPHLYRNDTPHGGPPHFTDVSAASGLQIRNPATSVPLAKTLAVAPIDLNEDGWMDLVVANDTVQNFVFTNRHDGTFVEVGVASGVAFDAYGQTRGAMGIDAARFRNDGALAIAIGNFANEMNALYVSQPMPDQLMFADEATHEGIGLASRQWLKFGLFFFDYDLDGRLDVLTANGHIEEEIERVQPGTTYRQPAQLFWNAGGRQSFVPVGPQQSGPDLFQPLAGRGSAYADFDLDGDLDVVLTQVGGPPVVLRNDQHLGHHWLRLRLIGSPANPDAIGAWVRARVNGQTLARQVMPTKSYLSQSELPITIGLGDATSVEGIQIRWPDGKVQILPVSGIDRVIEVREP